MTGRIKAGIMYMERDAATSGLAHPSLVDVMTTRTVTWPSGGSYLLDRAYKCGYNMYGKRLLSLSDLASG